MANGIDEEADCVDNVRDDEDTDGVSRAQSSPALEGQEVHSTANNEHDESRQTQEPYGQGSAVFVELKADKAVDQQTGA